ncbi:MAG: hypothetical protein JW791_03345 [Nanoarchaeota archaeon]|nr:hypothetical protein [Nanoarchaeota archaeon]
MKRSEPSLTSFKDESISKLVNKTGKRTLAKWAISCVKKVLKYNSDERLSKAVNTLKEWLRTGVFSMKVIRKASLDSHAAARESKEYSSARSAARAAGQAVATAHVSRHALGASIYSLQAVYRDGKSVVKERDWQLKQLLKLRLLEKQDL